MARRLAVVGDGVADPAVGDGLDPGGDEADLARAKRRHRDAFWRETSIDAEVLSAEIDGDRKQLEDWTCEAVRWFAYPWGGLAQLVPFAVEHVRRAGFEAAFTALPGSLDRAADRFQLPRQTIDVLGRPTLWSARLDGGYDFVFATKRYLPRVG